MDRVAPFAEQAPHDDSGRLHAAASRPAVLTRVSPAVAEHVQRARRAAVFAQAGRHAAAERLLRDVAGALARRQAREPCARVLIDLGRLQLTRGRAAGARQAFAEAAALALDARAPGVALDAALWEAGALTELARLDDAAALVQARLDAGGSDASHRAWAAACLVRIALWRDDDAEAAAHVPPPALHAEPAVAAWIESVAVRALLAAQRTFEAGRRLAAARARPELHGCAQARLLLERSQLCVLGEAGDLEGAAACLERVRRHAREVHVPLDAVRATLVWLRLLRRGGLDRDVQAVRRALQRTASAAPPLLRLAIERDTADGSRAAARVAVRSAPTPPPSLVPEIAGPSAALDELRRAIVRAGPAPFAVLIEGESGAGKELVARAIHRLSPRAARRFCDLNCAALPDELVEAELFGHARGAFTGAPADRAGLFEEASGGTLFLDEVSELSLRAQAKLLRVLQQQEVRRLGEAQTRTIDVRVVAAANRPMTDEAAAGRFRADLLYRLDVVRLRVPPLRERPDDVIALARHFVRLLTPAGHVPPVLAPDALTALNSHRWPGNVRELRNVIERSLAFEPLPPVLRAEHLRIA